LAIDGAHERLIAKKLIVTDSLSTLNTVLENYPKNEPRTRLIANLMDNDENIKLLWVPAHRGISGNEEANKAAKESLGQAETENSKVSAYDLIKAVNRLFTSQRQNKWIESDNPMKEYKPRIELFNDTSHLNRREQVIITRLRTGYSFLTHAHRINMHTPAECGPCSCVITIDQIG